MSQRERGCYKAHKVSVECVAIIIFVDQNIAAGNSKIQIYSPAPPPQSLTHTYSLVDKDRREFLIGLVYISMIRCQRRQNSHREHENLKKSRQKNKK